MFYAGASRAGGDKSFARQRYFIETVGAMDNPRFFRAEQREDRRDWLE